MLLLLLLHIIIVISITFLRHFTDAHFHPMRAHKTRREIENEKYYMQCASWEVVVHLTILLLLLVAVARVRIKK